ncbi:MAG: 3-deoxy-D-manno-octulosonic acid transferase [Desulfobacteraceae bacterium]|nr:MAG: 3-deoxy-D-manno-octulosonic acid transferase [Desulfobacteraceae bacterium]
MVKLISGIWMPINNILNNKNFDSMRIPKKIAAALSVYESLWRWCMPLLRLNSRMQEGFADRCTGNRLPPADLWIQAASAGESFLAWSLMETLQPDRPIRVLVTTTTRQGLDILQRAIDSASKTNPQIIAACAYFPFDRPSIMEQAVRRVHPRLMVLLETEIWPGLLTALKKNNRKTVIINGRLTPKSLKRYLIWPSLWKTLSPDRILAISGDDASRFAALFGQEIVRTMSNIKFDRLQTETATSGNPLQKWLPDTVPFLVLGSVREPEEEDIGQIIEAVRSRVPGTVIGLFPRHMHRMAAWEQRLTRLDIPWQLRSSLDNAPAKPGTVILWDMFGELNHAYALASAVFVGGSLAPLGGQNFLEPMIHGIVPVIGPFWDNFAWVGNDIFEQGLAMKVPDGPAVAAELVRQLTRPKPAPSHQAAAVRYIEERKGGSIQACRVIKEYL